MMKQYVPIVHTLLLLLCTPLACSDPPNPVSSTENTSNTAGTIEGGSESTVVFEGGRDLPDTCRVGEELGLCAICGPLLEPIKPADDENCPYIDCSSLTQYQAMNTEDGGRVCMQYLADPPSSSCRDLGQCYETPEEACTLNPTPVPLVTVYPGCGEFTGCEGEISPDGSQKPEGAECHGLGMCGPEGRCSAPPSCNGVHPTYVQNFCPDSNAPDQCDKYIDLNGTDNADDVNCTIACATIGGCQTGWDSNGGCNKGGEIGCNTRRRQLICRCEQ